MLLLLFQIGRDRYALEARQAVEVIPLLALKPLPHAPRGVAGVFNYRGRPVPAVDLSLLTVGRPAHAKLSTRIIVLQRKTESGDTQLLGVIAERATGLMRKETRQALNPERTGAGSGFLGPVIMDESGFVQLVRAENLLGQSSLDGLVEQLSAFSHETS